MKRQLEIILVALLVQVVSGQRNCTLKQFQCGDGKCVPLSWTCDGEVDCEDGTDEGGKMCDTKADCGLEEFRCGNDRCVPSAWLCDGEVDCKDGSDEDPKNCWKQTCSEDEFSCSSLPTECIPLSWQCDGHLDCTDGSDESSCKKNCTQEEFKCHNGNCIPLGSVCDGDNDCGDSSDEKSCPPKKCSDQEFQCSEDHCIPKTWVCDGEFDCSDMRDEANCSKPLVFTPCYQHEFECADQITCIHKTQVCDGIGNCPDSSDESLALCHNVTCPKDMFQCANKECIPQHFRCSGEAECADGSDELNCPKSKKPEEDCKECFQSDQPEGDCATNNGGCEQLCINTPGGHLCACHPGFHHTDGSCHDINECQIPGSCSQICHNTPGSFSCSCHPGYHKDPKDPAKCLAPGEPSLLFTTRYDVRKLTLHDEITHHLAKTAASFALDYSFRDDLIFWSDVSENKIYSSFLNGTSAKAIINGTSSEGLAADWVHKRLYYTDVASGSIHSANFDGSMPATLVKNAPNPRSIAVDPQQAVIFWSDWGNDPKIEKASLDGTSRTTIASKDVIWPNGLTLDYTQNRLYWIDAKTNSISSCDYSGKARRKIISGQNLIKHGFSIAVFEDSVFWADWDQSAIFKANKFSGKEITRVSPKENTPPSMGLKIFHEVQQPQVENLCAQNKCSDVCVPTPGAAQKNKCICSKLGILLPDGSTCAHPKYDLPTSTTEGTLYWSDLPEEFTTSEAEEAEVVTGKPEVAPQESSPVLLVVCVSLAVLAALTGALAFLIYRRHTSKNMVSMSFNDQGHKKYFVAPRNNSDIGFEAQEPLNKDVCLA